MPSSPPAQSGPAAAAAKAFAKGRPLAAAILQVQEVNWKAAEDLPNTAAKKLLGIYMWHAGDIGAAKSIFESLIEHAGDDAEIPEYLGMVLLQLGQPQEAASFLLYINQLAPERIDICEALAQAFWQMGDQASFEAFNNRITDLRNAESSAAVLNEAEQLRKAS